MSERIDLPSRRPATTFLVEHESQEYCVTVGQNWTPPTDDAPGLLDLDAEPVEVFVQAKRTSSSIEAVARDAAIIASWAMQLGAPFERMALSMSRDPQGRPLSVVGAVLDGMGREFPRKEKS